MNYDYHCGVIDAFNEVIKAEVKSLALSHPSTEEEIQQLLPFVEKITKQYGTHYEIEPDLLITDLFPKSANDGKTVILFWKHPNVIETYHALKQQKTLALQNHTYNEVREEIARSFGKLLSYSDDAITQYIQNNTEKE